MSHQNLCYICLEKRKKFKSINLSETKCFELIYILKQLNTDLNTNQEICKICNDCYHVLSIPKYKGIETNINLSCYVCINVYFETFEELKSHLIEHKNKHCCEVCNEIIVNDCLRKKHKDDHTLCLCITCQKKYVKNEYKKHKCNEKEKVLYTLEQLNSIVDIINEITKNGPNTSSNNASTSSNSSNNLSLSTPNIKISAPVCPVCKTLCQSRMHLIEHFINHKKQHTCKNCDKIFPNRRELITHIFDKACCFYTCPRCYLRFSIENFIDHIIKDCKDNKNNIPIFMKSENSNNFGTNQVKTEIQIKPENDIIIKTEKLDPEFGDPIQNTNNYLAQLPSSSNFEINTRHLRNSQIFVIKNNWFLFRCYLCEKTFNELKKLIKHLNIHEQVVEICFTCFRVFETKIEFDEHGNKSLFCVHPPNINLLSQRRKKNLKKQIKEYTTFIELKKLQQQNLESKIKTEPLDSDIDDDSSHSNNNDSSLENSKFKKRTDYLTLQISQEISDTDKIINRINELNYKIINTKRITKKKNDKYHFKPSTVQENTNTANDEFDLMKKLPRILELRNKLFRKKYSDETDNKIDECQNSENALENENDVEEPLAKKIKINSNSNSSLGTEFIDTFTEKVNFSTDTEDVDQPVRKKVKIEEE